MTSTSKILVTGATSGLGREMALQLAARGDAIIASGRREKRLKELCAHSSIQSLTLDLTSDDAIRSACRHIQDLSGVILNAGITFSDPYTSGDYETDLAIIQTNILANLRLIRALIPALKRRQGRILIIASLGGLTPLPYQSVYAGTKAFMVNFGLSLREELKHENIRVSVFAPGGIQTEMTDIPAMQAFKKDLAPVNDVAAAAIRAYDKMPAISVPGKKNKLVSAFAKIAPKSFVAAQAERIYRQAREKSI